MPAAKHKKSVVDRYAKMTLDELRKETAEFDREFAIDQCREPTPEELAKFKKLKRRGRPTVGGGAIRISLTIENGLLKRADKIAKNAKLKRSQLVGIALRKLIAATETRQSRERK
jgi:hypothetical protein